MQRVESQQRTVGGGQQSQEYGCGGAQSCNPHLRKNNHGAILANDAGIASPERGEAEKTRDSQTKFPSRRGLHQPTLYFRTIFSRSERLTSCQP
jgi:hypothetical protein